MKEEYVWKILNQMLNALNFCHLKGIDGKKVLHRDIKPGNIFLDKDGNVKLGDFGLARVLATETSMAQSVKGTTVYLAPVCFKSHITEDTFNINYIIDFECYTRFLWLTASFNFFIFNILYIHLYFSVVYSLVPML